MTTTDMLIDDEFNVNYLRLYYAKLFPYVDFFKWLSYGNDGKHPACDKSYFGRREFSFTLDNDSYLRFQSFNTVSELENSVREKCPFKIDIGPVYSVDPSKSLFPSMRYAKSSPLLDDFGVCLIQIGSTSSANYFSYLEIGSCESNFNMLKITLKSLKKVIIVPGSLFILQEVILF